MGQQSSTIELSEQESLGLLHSLPNELMHYLLSFFSPQEICVIGRLNHYFQDLTAGAGVVWHQHFCESNLYNPSLASRTYDDKIDWKALYKTSAVTGWRLGTDPLYCGEAIVVSKDGLSCWVKKGYGGPAMVQQVKTARGVSQGKHHLKVRIEGSIIASTSFGICTRSSPPHGHVECIQFFSGDGTLNLLEGTRIRAEGRIKGRVVDGDLLEMTLDFEAGEMSYFVNGERWVVIENIDAKQDTWHFFIGLRAFPTEHFFAQGGKKCVLHIVPENGEVKKKKEKKKKKSNKKEKEKEKGK